MLKSEIQNLQHEISKSSMRIDDGLSADLIKIMSNADKSEVSPFMKFFWEEQQKYINVSCKTSIRYHPMIIRYCLALQAKSAAAYNEIRLGLALLYYQVKEDFEIIKIISIQNKVLPMK